MITIFKVIFNDENEFNLVRWSHEDFKNSLTLMVMGMDIVGLKAACQNIDKVEIYNEDALVASYKSFDTFSSITYHDSVFMEELKIFTEALSVTLTKANIVDIVTRLDEQINPVVDVQAMDVETYRQYKLDEISRDCTASIYEGDQVALSDGHVETFSFTDKDQVDLQALSSIAMLNPEIELTWHSNGNLCKFYSGVDIILIYQTLNMKLFRETTICNAINLLVHNAQSKDEIAQYYWGCELPQAEQDRINALISRMSAIVSQIIAQLIPPTEPESGDEGEGENNPVNPTNPTNPTDEGENNSTDSNEDENDSADGNENNNEANNSEATNDDEPTEGGEA